MNTKSPTKPIMIDNSKDKNWFQIIAVIIAGASAISNGIFFTWPSPFILKISKDKENYNITEEEASLFSVYSSITTIICCPIFSKLSDIFGRKRILLLTAFVDVSIWILKAAGRRLYVLYLARILVGISDGIMFASLPAYLGEVASPKIRGTWGNSMTIGFLLGELLVTIVGSYCNVQETSYIFMPIPVLFFIAFSFMPESPYFYLMKGRNKDAKQSLQTLKRKKDVTEDFLALKADVDRQMSEDGTWKEMFMIDSNRRALIAAVFLKVSQTLGGAQTFVIFTQYIFDKFEGSFSTEVSSIIFISLSCILSVCACLAVQWLGRKRAYIGSLIPCSIVLLFQAIYFFISQKRPDIDISSFNWVPIAGMVLYSIFSSYGLGIMPTLMLGELFSTSFRSKAMGVLLIISGLVTCASSPVFYALSSNFGLYSPYLFFACCNLISSILAFFILPETKNKTLEEIQQSMKDKKSKTKDESEELIGIKAEGS